MNFRSRKKFPTYLWNRYYLSCTFLWPMCCLPCYLKMLQHFSNLNICFHKQLKGMYLKLGFPEGLCHYFASTKIKLKMRDFVWYFLSSLDFWDNTTAIKAWNTNGCKHHEGKQSFPQSVKVSTCVKVAVALFSSTSSVYEITLIDLQEEI